MLNTHLNKERLIITSRENGGAVDYNYQFFKEDFEEWATELDIQITDTDDLKLYLVECGYKIINIKEEE